MGCGERIAHQRWHDSRQYVHWRRHFIDQLSFANLADPQAMLFYNDFKIETGGAKQDGAYSLIRALKALGAPIHALGIQGHMSTDLAPPSVDALRSTIRRFAGLGLKVMFTELDVRTKTSDGLSATESTWQHAYFNNVTRACMLEPACTGVTTWGFTQNFSWIHSSFPGYSAAMPFDVNYQPTSIYGTIFDALK
jgi:endo-1,4-beta-xylanase